MITMSGENGIKEETHVNSKSLEHSNILTKRGYYVLDKIHFHYHSFQKKLEEGSLKTFMHT